MRGRPGSDERRVKQLRTYERWWLGKLVRLPTWMDRGFRRVVAIKFIAPPSAVYGDVWLTFEDGTEDNVFVPDEKAFKPRKTDVEVQEEKA